MKIENKLTKMLRYNTLIYREAEMLQHRHEHENKKKS